MSDLGVFAALEADLAAKAATVSGVTQVVPSLSVDDVLFKDGIVKPTGVLVGVVKTATKNHEPSRGCNVGNYWGRISFQFVIASMTARGGVSNRPSIYATLEGLRAAVHFQQPATLPVPITGLYYEDEEEFVTEKPKALIVATANYHIDLSLGN